MSSQGESGCFCTQGRLDTGMGGGSFRENDSSASLSLNEKMARAKAKTVTFQLVKKRDKTHSFLTCPSRSSKEIRRMWTGPGPECAIGGDTVAVRLGSEASGRRRVTGGRVRV